MLQVLKTLFNELPGADPRTADWPMVSSFYPTLALCLTYAYFSKILGPKLMENHKPFQLKKVLIYYNLFQVVLSVWLFYEALIIWTFHYNFRCEPVDYSNAPLSVHMAGLCWFYYISKITELLDTVFFVMRKKYNQVSNLHVIHHGIMPIWAWCGVKFLAGGHATFFGFLNTFVHIFMYSYYLLAAMGPEYQKYIWWKKYLTKLQMCQFIAILIHDVQFYISDCDYPKIIPALSACNCLMFLFMFGNFYIQAYTQEQRLKRDGIAASNRKAAKEVVGDDTKKEY